MNLSTRLMPRPRAEGRGLFSAINAGERLGSSPPFHPVTLTVLRIRRVGLTVLMMATLCSTISRVAADPSVEVFTRKGKVTSPALFPYAPRFSVLIGGGYDDNVKTTTGGTGSAFTNAHVSLSKDLHTARTQLTVGIGAGVVYYFDRASGGTKVTSNLDVSLKHKVSQRLTLSAVIDAAFRTEPDFGTDLGPQRRANYFRTTDTLTASYLWSPRFSTNSSYILRSVEYEEAVLSAGQDRVEQTFEESFRFRWSPRTTLVADYRFGLVDYDSSPRDSSTHTALGGLDYQFNPQLKATVRGGATFRTYENEANGKQTNPYASASLNYVLGHSTSLHWTARYSIEEPNSAVALSRTTLRTGLVLKYAFTKRLTSHLALNYNHNVNVGLLGLPGAERPESTEDLVYLGVGAKYAMSKRVSLDFGYAHTELDSESRANGGYTRNRYSAGLTLNY